MKDINQLLDEARLPERTVQVCLRGDLVAAHEAADRALIAALANPGSGKEDGTAPLVEQVERIQQQMRDSTVVFRLRAMLRTEFRALMAAHPPRRTADGEPDPGDVQSGFNRETYWTALLKASTVEPELTEEQWDKLLVTVTDRQYGDLTDAAFYVNRDEVSVPFSRAVLRARRISGDE